MILEMRSESLKRPAKYSNCFPLKKRRIKYDEESDIVKSEEPTLPHLLEISEPENLSTKPQDLRLTNPQIKLELNQIPAPSPPNKTEMGAGMHRVNNPTFHDAHVVFAQQNRSGAGALEPISLNGPNPWSPPGPFRYDERIHRSFPHPHRLHQFHHHDAPFNLDFQAFAPLQLKREQGMNPPPQLRNLQEIQHSPKGIRMEMAEFQRHPPRDSVISHSNHAPHFPLTHPYHHRDTLSRGSCDSGVSSPSGSSTGSHSSTTSPPSVTPTLVGGSLRYSCPTCHKSYSTVSGLSKHVQFHCTTQNPKSFVCKDCDKVYNSLGALKMHIRTHTLPCKCNVCGKAFSRPWLLQGHVRTHTGEKPFGCQHCQRAFADRSNLRAHLQTHSELKKYSCRVCAKTFSRMSLLAKHQDTGCSVHSS